jgi:hypothetical protein
MAHAIDTFKIGDFVQPIPDLATTISKYPEGSRFMVLALHHNACQDPAGNVDLQLPDGNVEPCFPVSRLRLAAGEGHGAL